MRCYLVEWDDREGYPITAFIVARDRETARVEALKLVGHVFFKLTLTDMHWQSTCDGGVK